MTAATAGLRGARRSLVVALAVIGVGLIAAPAVFKMFDRAPKGANMMKGFKPYMKHPRLDVYQREIRQIDTGVREGDTLVAARLTGPTTADHRRFDARFPQFAGFRREWVGINADMSDLLNRIQANVGNYNAVAALPSFKLFPWFFVLPGVILLGLLALPRVRPRTSGGARWALVALGLGLVAAPAIFQMFDRAPKGATMVNAFRTIETRKKVETIQGYFGSIAVGQGSVRLQLVPALRKTGLSDAQIAARYPGITTLDRRWITILGDFTPMIGTMSDNVDNYNAVKALPSFKLFPWFFVILGLLVAGLAFATGRSRRPGPQVATLGSPRPEGTA
jgi:hypothetical protein